MALARDAAAAGDTIEMENCYQHAEHFLRVMIRTAGARFGSQLTTLNIVRAMPRDPG